MTAPASPPTSPADAAPGDRREALASLLALGQRAAGAYGRPALAERLERRRRRLLDEAARVVLLGEYKAGKSSLVNALLGAELCPVDDDIATAVPTLVRWGPETTASLVDLDDATRRRPLALDERRQAICEPDIDEEATTRDAVELTVDRALLRRGLELVDTPGVGGLRSAHTAAAIAGLDDADAVVFVTDASQELTGAELEVLERVVERCADVVVVVTKIDLYPHWRRIVEADEEHLGRRGIDLAVIATSAPLRWRAIERGDADLDVESGYRDVLAVLREGVVDQAAALAVDRAAEDLVAAVDQLVADFEAERRALDDPDARAAHQARLDEARERLEALTRGASRWQTALSDGINDLANDVDHDLRTGMRALTAEANARLDELDPAQSWDEFAAWLENAAVERVVANQRVLRDRAGELLARVASHFDEDADLDLVGEAVTTSASVTDHTPEVDGPGLLKQAIGGLRGSYSGLMMFGMIGSMAGVAVATPVLAGLGLLLGARQLRDERERRLKAHRQQAQVSVRKYLDEVSFEVTKANRDHVKRIQRGARDHFAARVGELRERIQRAQQIAEAVKTADPDRRRADIDAELDRLRRLRATVEEVAWP